MAENTPPRPVNGPRRPARPAGKAPRRYKILTPSTLRELRDLPALDRRTIWETLRLMIGLAKRRRGGG